ncbi:tRNA pseudouridine(38-40) synthase TruA [Clostridiaceae bacterium HSG29]|nr:tRNA pseudouridine(38-40) synthase TruA [Clostridiaceae bacterium HSG29]
MKNYKMTIEYDGSKFYGWQKLNDKRTVQKEIERIFKKITYQNIRVHGSGRTDKFVHSIGQVASFEIDLKIPLEKFKYILNRNLPDDIFIKEIEEVDSEFHARFSAKKKRYRYKIYTGVEKEVFLNNYYYHFPYELDIDKMIVASKKIIGKKDFRSFVAKSINKENTIRTIESINIIKKDSYIDIVIIGDGFLYKMVRTIVGNLIDIGRGLITVDELENIINEKDIKKAKFTAPANGLYLEKVEY